LGTDVSTGENLKNKPVDVKIVEKVPIAPSNV